VAFRALLEGLEMAGSGTSLEDRCTHNTGYSSGSLYAP
jgi:hypothetical protein